MRPFLEKEDREVYILHFDVLIMLLNFIIDNTNSTGEYVNNFIKNDLDDCLMRDPVIPEPCIIKEQKVIIKSRDSGNEEVFNIHNMTDDEVDKLITE